MSDGRSYYTPVPVVLSTGSILSGSLLFSLDPTLDPARQACHLTRPTFLHGHLAAIDFRVATKYLFEKDLLRDDGYYTHGSPVRYFIASMY
jgi:hypothetical protein